MVFVTAATRSEDQVTQSEKEMYYDLSMYQNLANLTRCGKIEGNPNFLKNNQEKIKEEKEKCTTD